MTAVGLVGWFSFRNGQRAIGDLVQQLQREVNTRVQERLTSYLAVPHAINRSNVATLDLGYLKLNDLRSMERYLWRQIQTFDRQVSYIAFSGTDGEYVGVGLNDEGTPYYHVTEYRGELRRYSADFEGNRGRFITAAPNFDPRARNWYTVPQKMQQPTWSEIYLWVDPPVLAVSLGKPYYNEDGEFAGVLAVDWSLPQLSEFLRTLKIGQSGQVFIVEGTGNLVASSSDFPPLVMSDGAPQRVRATEFDDLLIRETARYIDRTYQDWSNIPQNQPLSWKIDGHRYFAQILPFSDEAAVGLDWFIAIVVPESDFMAQINANTRNTIVLCGVALALAIGLGIVTARWINRPLQRL
ncbi:MAG: PDC sensor domain-containing protein, partial [Cyanobacteria bacterium SBC]|nr:PDC sensor domain-containing protein [Cyanobacteria bacterium SBC]